MDTVNQNQLNEHVKYLLAQVAQVEMLKRYVGLSTEECTTQELADKLDQKNADAKVEVAREGAMTVEEFFRQLPTHIVGVAWETAMGVWVVKSRWDHDHISINLVRAIQHARNRAEDNGAGVFAANGPGAPQAPSQGVRVETKPLSADVTYGKPLDFFLPDEGKITKLQKAVAQLQDRVDGLERAARARALVTNWGVEPNKSEQTERTH